MVENKGNKEEKMWSAYSLALNLGWMIIVPVVVFGVGGVLVDKKFDLFPIFTVIGFVISMTSALLTVYYKTKDIIITGKPKQK
ncbi:MAG: AtpZ/AtpI family protein [Candidatus Gracilibacteria bacterium]